MNGYTGDWGIALSSLTRCRIKKIFRSRSQLEVRSRLKNKIGGL